MAELGISTKIWIDQFDLSGVSNSVTIDVGSDVVDTTCFQATAATGLTRPGEASISHAGFWTGPAAGNLEAELFARLATRATTVAVVLGTNVALCPVYIAPNSGSSGLKVNMPTKDVVTVEGSWTSGTGIKRGLRVFDGTISALTATATRDFAAAGTTGGIAYLWVRAITGTAVGADIVVQSATASDFSDAVTEATFTFSAVGDYTVALSGAIGRYIRLLPTDLGGATNFAVGCAVVVHGVTMM